MVIKRYSDITIRKNLSLLCEWVLNHGVSSNNDEYDDIAYEGLGFRDNYYFVQHTNKQFFKTVMRYPEFFKPISGSVGFINFELTDYFYKVMKIDKKLHEFNRDKFFMV